MIDFYTFKKSLGDKAAALTDEEIEHRRITADRLADTFFDYWIRKRNSSKIKIPADKPEAK